MYFINIKCTLKKKSFIFWMTLDLKNIMGQPGKKNFKGQKGSTLGRPNQIDIPFISFKPRLRFGTEILFSPVDLTLFFTQNQ